MGNDGYASDYHGKDGFGDALSDSGPDLQLMQSEPAAVALLRLVNEYPGKLTIYLALAYMFLSYVHLLAQMLNCILRGCSPF